MKKLILTAAAVFAVLAVMIICITFSQDEDTSEYGVYIGAESGDRIDTEGKKEIVIDAEYFDKSQVAALKKTGTKVYSYLDIGSLEDFRDDYEDYKHLALAPYDNWPGEYWLDVSDAAWQSHIIYDRAGALYAKGVDGFFIDNTDVYYHYENEETYVALCTILYGLQSEYMLPIMINGGDMFVTRALAEEEYPPFDAVNQETVFSKIDDYEKSVFSENPADERQYYIDYLSECNKKGIKVYLLEYTKDRELKDQIKEFANANGYSYYISESIGLK